MPYKSVFVDPIAEEEQRLTLSAWWADDSAVTAIEYGLLAALIVIAIIGAMSAAGDSVLAIFAYWSNAVIAALNLS